MTLRILIDQDSTIYDLSTPWYKLHNDEYGDIHTMTIDDIHSWDTSLICKENKCDADIYAYFEHASVWSEGMPIGDSIAITNKWAAEGHELGILTTIDKSAIVHIPLKYAWLDHYFPHIPNVIMVNTHVKHWLDADVLIDDGLHNVEHFKGISLLYDQPWNRNNTALPRIKDWQHADIVIERINTMISDYEMQAVWSQRQPMLKWIQFRILQEIRAGDL